MFTLLKRRLRAGIEARLDSEVLERIDALKAHLGGHETDAFGFHPDTLKTVIPLVSFFYRDYFRVETFGLDGIPPGRVLFIANHSGQIPIDAMMIASALILDAHPPRAVRSMIERWVPSLPWVSVLFSRLGQVLGTPENCTTLLKGDHAVLVFPEGVRGINKTWEHRYQLQQFGHGFMRLALATNTPIVPVGVVGAEEQLPTFWNLKSVGKFIGLPALPISLSPVPLPTKYRIHFGRPMTFEGDPNEDETLIGARVAEVRDAVDGLLQRGLEEREHIFW